MNVMGLSKRISELIIQSYAEAGHNQKKVKRIKYNFSMVRFGNVLNSSGSVVPIFKKQIESGGPIYLTHKNVIRFFMTLKEAAQLVIQSSAMAKGGEVFLLDMGDPVLIKELAVKMINLSGLKLKDSSNPQGDIEIKEIGLKPGEKLYEEVLIDNKSKSTLHPAIFCANERFHSADFLFPKLDILKDHIEDNNINEVAKIINELVPDGSLAIFLKKN